LNAKYHHRYESESAAKVNSTDIENKTQSEVNTPPLDKYLHIKHNTQKIDNNRLETERKKHRDENYNYSSDQETASSAIIFSNKVDTNRLSKSKDQINLVSYYDEKGKRKQQGHWGHWKTPSVDSQSTKKTVSRMIPSIERGRKLSSAYGRVVSKRTRPVIQHYRTRQATHGAESTGSLKKKNTSYSNRKPIRQTDSRVTIGSQKFHKSSRTNADKPMEKTLEVDSIARKKLIGGFDGYGDEVRRSNPNYNNKNLYRNSVAFQTKKTFLDNRNGRLGLRLNGIRSDIYYKKSDDRTIHGKYLKRRGEVYKIKNLKTGESQSDRRELRKDDAWNEWPNMIPEGYLQHQQPHYKDVRRPGIKHQTTKPRVNQMHRNHQLQIVVNKDIGRHEFKLTESMKHQPVRNNSKKRSKHTVDAHLIHKRRFTGEDKIHAEKDNVQTGDDKVQRVDIKVQDKRKGIKPSTKKQEGQFLNFTIPKHQEIRADVMRKNYEKQLLLEENTGRQLHRKQREPILQQQLQIKLLRKLESLLEYRTQVKPIMLPIDSKSDLQGSIHSPDMLYTVGHHEGLFSEPSTMPQGTMAPLKRLLQREDQSVYHSLEVQTDRAAKKKNTVDRYAPIKRYPKHKSLRSPIKSHRQHKSLRSPVKSHRQHKSLRSPVKSHRQHKSLRSTIKKHKTERRRIIKRATNNGSIYKTDEDITKQKQVKS